MVASAAGETQLMTILADFSVHLDFDTFCKRLHLDRYGGDVDEVREFFDRAAPVARPKAVYDVAYVNGRDADRVTIGEVIFQSDVLARNLADIGKVYPYVATCGVELNEVETSPGDPLEEFWLDTLKEQALQEATRELRSRVLDAAGAPKMSTMNPGSADAYVWPIQQQRQLFTLLGNVEEAIGVRLTPSYLMVPNKSVSGLYFATGVSFINCQMCTREDCPNRRAPYKGASAER